jgi:hypothetical protein
MVKRKGPAARVIGGTPPHSTYAALADAIVSNVEQLEQLVAWLKPEGGGETFVPVTRDAVSQEIDYCLSPSYDREQRAVLDFTLMEQAIRTIADYDAQHRDRGDEPFTVLFRFDDIVDELIEDRSEDEQRAWLPALERAIELLRAKLASEV